jgi:ubiquinone/menaquinone biosynthesis C-methylase UbiE
MADNPKHHVCSASHAFFLDNWLRRAIQDPVKILKGHITQGQTALDIGCGPGAFTTTMTEMVGENGKVIAADIQEEMLEKVRKKAQKAGLIARVQTHKSEQERIGVTEPVDFALAFYMAHEVPDKLKFFKEIATTLKPGGRLLLVEPVFHVSKAEYENTIHIAKDSGLSPIKDEKIPFSRATLLGKSR